jgi:hypothetical protein
VVITDRLALDVETFRMMLGEALEKCSNVHVRALLHGCSFGGAAIVNGGNCDLELYNTHEEFKDYGLLFFFVSGTGGNAHFGAIHD